MATREYTKTIVENEDPTVRTRVIRDERPSDARFAIVYYLLNIVEVLLLVRLFLKLLGANAGAAFTNAVYTITNPLVSPFTGIFPSPAVAGSTLEWSSIVAMIVYALVAYAVVQLLRVASPRRYTF